MPGGAMSRRTRRHRRTIGNVANHVQHIHIRPTHESFDLLHEPVIGY